jgi:hypothetical protein
MFYDALTMPLRIFTLFTLLFFTPSAPLWAQCQSFSLFFGIDQTGTLDASDCTVIPIGRFPVGFPEGLSGPGEYWTMQVAAGDRVTITTESTTVPLDLIVEGPPSGWIITRGNDFSRLGRATVGFEAVVSGTYRVAVRSETSLAPGCCGTFVIRATVVSLCPGVPLYWEREESGELHPADVGDCRPNYYPPRDVWTLELTHGDYAVVTLRTHVLVQPNIVILDPSGVGYGGDEDPTPYLNLQMRVAFRARVSGTYRVIVTSHRQFDFGPYTLRVDRVTTPLFAGFFASVLGDRLSIGWGPAFSPTPILEYVLLVGSAPGREDLARIPVGTTRQLIAVAPPGVYYMRVRARNEAGVGDTPERAIVVGPHLSAPGELLVTSVVGRRVTLSWSPPATPGTAYYEVTVGSASGQTDVGVWNVGNVLNVTADAVAPDTYYVRVRAVNAQGPGAESNEVVVSVR